MPGDGAYEPGAHLEAMAAPVAQEAPAGQTTHSAAETMATPRAARVAFWRRKEGGGGMST